MNRLINEGKWEPTYHSLHFLRLSDTAWCVEGQKQDMISKWQIASLTKMAMQSGWLLIWYSWGVERAINGEFKFPQMLLIFAVYTFGQTGVEF